MEEIIAVPSSETLVNSSVGALTVPRVSSAASSPEAPTPKVLAKPASSRRRKQSQRTPPPLKVSLSRAPLLFPPLSPLSTSLLPYLPSSLILPARVSSTALAHIVNLHVRSNTLLLHDTTLGSYKAVLQLPPESISTRKGTITISSIGYSPLHIRPSVGNTGPLLKALRPIVPPIITITRKISDRVFIARFKRQKVALKLFKLDDLPEYAIATRVALQRARGDGVVPLLAAIQGRGYCGIVTPIFNDLATYVSKFGKLSAANARGVIAQLVRGLCRVHQLGCEVGEFSNGDVLIHRRGAMHSRVRHANVLHRVKHDGLQNDHGGEWKDTLRSLVSLIRDCCDVDEGGEGFIEGCERLWSANEMVAHSWVKEAAMPRLRKIRVRGSKDILDIPRRIGYCGKGILGWEFYYKA